MTKVHTFAELSKDPKPIEDIFFDAMYHIYAGARLTKKDTINDAQFEYKSGIWRVVTRIRADDYVSGEVCIYGAIDTNEVLLWAMHHFGVCTEKQISFLNYVLGGQYRNRIFLGGRGPKKIKYGKQSYENAVEVADFKKFFGMETLSTDDNAPAGWLQYCGGLVPHT